MKKMDWIKILVLAALVLAGIAGTGAAAPLLSNSGGGSWQYYREITVKENSGSTLTDYQVLVQLSSSDFPMNARSDGADIRFTDNNGNELNYWIESWDYAGRSAKIWVKVPNIAAGGAATIPMYYGNPSAGSSSSGDATFDLYDDFRGTGLDTNKWSSSGTISVSSGELSLYGLAWIKSKAEFGENIIEETRTKAGDGVGYYIGFRNDAVTKYITVRGSNGADPFHWDTSNGITWHGSNDLDPIAPYDTAYHIWKLEKNGITSAKIYQDGNLKYNLNQDLPSASGLKAFFMGGEYSGTYYYTYVDWVRIRKYASSEPTLTLGVEKTYSDLVAYWPFDGNALDLSGNGNHGTINGAMFVQGISGQALSFNGIDDYVNIGDKPSLRINGPYTVEAWVYSNQNNLGQILSKSRLHDLRNYELLWLDEGNGGPKIKFEFSINGVTYWTYSQLLKYKEWYYVAGVYDGLYMKLYVNGNQVAITSASGMVDVNTEPLTIGRRSDGVRFFNGIIDEVRIYNRALTTNEIQANYNALASTTVPPTTVQPTTVPTTPAPTPTSTNIPGGNKIVEATNQYSKLFNSEFWGNEAQARANAFLSSYTDPLSVTLKAAKSILTSVLGASKMNNAAGILDDLSKSYSAVSAAGNQGLLAGMDVKAKGIGGNTLSEEFTSLANLLNENKDPKKQLVVVSNKIELYRNMLKNPDKYDVSGAKEWSQTVKMFTMNKNILLSMLDSAQEFIDALKINYGMEVTQTNPPPSQSSKRIPGFEAFSVLMLIFIIAIKNKRHRQ